MILRCRTCHRVERIGPDGIATVELAGGSRRPAEPREVAVVEALVALAAEGLRLAGPCPACGMPRGSEAGGGDRWPVGGFVFVSDHFQAPDGARVAVADVLAAVRRAHPTPVDSKATRAFQVAILAAMVTPVLLWVFLFLYWLQYASQLAASPWVM